jgi:phospholipid/cholesterol/gamma-HCH transport system substrate-binding protein
MRDTSDRVPVDLVTSEAVSGLQPQAAVRYRGVDVGVVSSIALDPESKGSVVVRVMLDRNAPLSKESFATLGYQGVTGLAFIQLDDRAPSNEPPPMGKDNVPRIPLRGGLLSRLADQSGQMLDQLSDTMKRINDMLGDENQASLTRALTEIGDAAKAVDSLATNTNKLLSAQLDPSKTHVPKLVEEARVAISDMRAAAGSVSKAAGDFSTAVGRFDAKGGALDRVSEGANTFTASTLPRVHRAVESAERTIRQLDRTASTLNENPQAILYGSGAIPPGPGEQGFAPPPAAPSPQSGSQP